MNGQVEEAKQRFSELLRAHSMTWISAGRLSTPGTLTSETKDELQAARMERNLRMAAGQLSGPITASAARSALPSAT